MNNEEFVCSLFGNNLLWNFLSMISYCLFLIVNVGTNKLFIIHF